jgi:DNA-binding response OmpR family regulator
MAVPEFPIALLIVEATSQAAHDLSQSLAERFGPRLSIAATASSSEALRLARQQRIDLVVANVKCGEGDGLELCQELRAMPAMAEVPILLLSDRASTQDKIAGFSSGADDYVVRPIDMRLLAARIELLWRIKHVAQLSD